MATLRGVITLRRLDGRAGVGVVSSGIDIEGIGVAGSDGTLGGIVVKDSGDVFISSSWSETPLYTSKEGLGIGCRLVDCASIMTENVVGLLIVGNDDSIALRKRCLSKRNTKQCIAQTRSF